MKITRILTFAAVAMGLTAPSAHAVEKKGSRMVGAGLVFPAMNHSHAVNAAALTDAQQVAAEGLYGIDAKNIHGSVAAANSFVGGALGARFQHETSAYTIEGALAGDLGPFALGLTLRKLNLSTGGVNFDLGSVIDLGKFRLAVVSRGWIGGLDRLDLGLGWQSSGWLISLDGKWVFPTSAQMYLFDASVAYNFDRLGVALGYDFWVSGGFHNGGPHAGVSFELFRQFNLQAFYRPSAQDWDMGRWNVGLRYVF